MADVIQTRQQLIGDFAANTTRAITSQLLRDFVLSAMMNTGVWAAGKAYDPNDVSRRPGLGMYLCVGPTADATPPEASAYWQPFWEGAAASNTSSGTTGTTSGGTTGNTSGGSAATTVIDFSDLTGGYHIAYPANYGSNQPNTPNVTVSYGPNNILDAGWSQGLYYGMFANPTALVTITFTPTAGHAVTLQSFAASLYTGDAAGSYTFATLKVVDANGNVLWNPDPSTYPELTYTDKTTFSPNVTGPAGVAITLQFQDTATDGEVGCCDFTFSQS